MFKPIFTAEEQDTVIDGWVNVWTTSWGEPQTFNSYDKAELALDDHMADIADVVAEIQNKYDLMEIR